MITTIRPSPTPSFGVQRGSIDRQPALDAAAADGVVAVLMLVTARSSQPLTRVRGSMRPYSRSTTRLAPSTAMVMTRKMPCISA